MTEKLVQNEDVQVPSFQVNCSFYDSFHFSTRQLDNLSLSDGLPDELTPRLVFVAFVKDNATMSSIRYFENHVSYFVQNQMK